MKRFAMLVVVLSLAAPHAHAEIKHSVRTGGGGGAAKGGGAAQGFSPVMIRMHRYSMGAPTTGARGAWGAIHSQRSFTPPIRDAAGARITKPQSITPPVAHSSIVHNQGVVHSMQLQRPVERTPNHFYWHNQGGYRYAHYWDGRYHWYGFYHGPRFYWSLWFGDFWWWYDPLWSRWVYWYDGYWWWPGPAGVEYVYVDNNYYPYENGTVVTKEPEVQAPPREMPAPTSGQSVTSPDGKRMVQVTPEGDAFLYDKSGVEPAFVRFLGRSVTKVRFSSQNGKANVLLDLKDGSFALFDRDGNPLDTPAPAGEAGSKPPAPPVPPSEEPTPPSGTPAPPPTP